MAERPSRRRGVPRSASTESAETSMGKPKERKHHKKPKERWLLTRKTWRYMADAGRKLIPDGVQNRPEDIPKIEAYFQEMCKREPKFLLWRKNSYPGALSLRTRKRKERRKGGSCRKASSADEIEILRPERPTNLPLPHTSGSRFDIQKMKEDFLNKPPTPVNYSPFSMDAQPSPSGEDEDPEEKQLISMIEQYLSVSSKPNTAATSSSRTDLNYQELVDKLQRHLTLISRNFPQHPPPPPKQTVHFEGDHVQKSLSETLSRYFGMYPNRDRVISDLLTDRRALERLYFDLRQAKGFRSRRGGTGYPQSTGWSPKLRNYGNQRSGGGSYDNRKDYYMGSPPPLIEVQSESTETTYRNFATQTLPIPEEVLVKVEEEYKKNLAEKEEEERENTKQQGVSRRKSSVDHDDVSQSVSETIKRYLRMARKKSVDTDKVDRFKRVNYDRNLRNIKAKGEITKPGDDDGLNKGCQTNDDWILTYRDLKFDEATGLSDNDSRISSSRSSIDAGVDGDPNKSSPSSPPGILSSSHSFFSNLLHHKHHDKHDKNAAAAIATGAMQKSKSSSSVMHHGSRLVAKKIFRSRSKSQTRPSSAPSSWTPQRGCVWSNVTGRQVVLSDTTLLNLTEVERKVLQKVALARLQALNLGVAVKIPSETVSAAAAKPKKRPYLLKRRALTTSIFDTNRKDGEKDGKDGAPAGGLVFGIPLTQCVENDRLSRAAAGTSPFRSRGELSGSHEEPVTIGRHGSRASFSSLFDAPRGDESGSCESLMSRDRIVGSVPGLLDAISCGSTADINVAAEEESSVPNILTVCFRHLEAHGLHTLGIFRVSTSKKRIRQLREDFDCGKETTLDDEQCPHDVATLLKEYLRDLPDPLLCRDLYHAFVQTQKIRNRRLQFEALQHLIQLLPPANRDTLWALLSFLSIVAKHSGDSTDTSGETLSGNKMDSNNLATVFAPNILHCIKPGSSRDTSGDRPEDRIDVINVVRILIDGYQELFSVSAELLDEVYVHLMDSHPDVLDQLLNKRDEIAAADDSVEDLDSESYSAPWTPTQPTSDHAIDHVVQNLQADSDGRGTPPEPRKIYSREEFLHEAAATGGPNVAMRIRHKERLRGSRRRRDDSVSRRRREEDSDRSSGSSMSSAMTIISKFRGQKEDDTAKTRSSSLESTSSIHNDNEITRVLRISDDSSQGTDRRKSTPYTLDKSGVITASLTIPVQQSQSLILNVDDDIPYIEDDGRQQMTIGMVRSPMVPPRRRQRSMSGSDSSAASTAQAITGSISLVQGYDSAVGSSATFSSPVQNTPSSICSSIADAGVYSSPPSWASTPPTSPDSVHTSVNYIPDDIQLPARTRQSALQKTVSPDSPVLQKVSFTSASEVQQIRQVKIPDFKPVPKEVTVQKITLPEVQKSISSSAIEVKERETSQKFTPSITNIGNAVLRSKTADFERIAKADNNKPKTTPAPTTTTTTITNSDKKKYTKRRYTDSRHQTRHIPDAESLEAATNVQSKKETGATPAAGPVYKRRELISSVPSK